ncbi:hypothetical protein ONZ45_g3939 [Pleurotus djamor]|nr:hypothetical protein ONZ45_g3939 [Pleurotus djamor]
MPRPQPLTSSLGALEAKGKSLKSSKSVEHLHSKTPKGPLTSSSSYSLVQPGLDTLRRPSNASSISLAGVASTTLPSPRSSHHPKRAGTADSILDEPSPPSPIAASSLPVSPVSHRHHTHHTNGSNASDSGSESSASVPGTTVKQRRSAPPPPGPPKRRKPPAIPVGKTNGGATITAIKSSIPTSPLARTSYA